MKRIGCVVGAALLLAVPAFASSITKVATTASYKLTLGVKTKQAMYSAAEVKAKHPTSGEVMVGSMSGMGGMSMTGSGNRHLAVHVASRSTGKVLAIKPSSVTLTDTTVMSGMADKVDVVAMYGIGAGMADLHYGNNVKLTAGHTYKVVVTVKGEKASFTFRA